MLWSVKSASPLLGMAFPIIIALLVPTRIFVGRYFNNSDLEVLDDCGDAIAVGRELYQTEVYGHAPQSASSAAAAPPHAPPHAPAATEGAEETKAPPSPTAVSGQATTYKFGE